MISFHCEERLIDVIPNPRASIKAAPSFFKKIPPQINERPSSGTVKRCVPFLDALSIGYIIPLWCDVWVEATDDGNIKIDFPENFFQSGSISEHAYEQAPNHPLSETLFGKALLKFMNPWVIETEENVSCLFTSPLNHLETRFKILDGVVDTDTYYNNINFPFVWTGGVGKFMIERGTPLVQVIPFQRTDFQIEVGKIDELKKSKVNAILGTKIKDGYRTDFWNKQKQAEPE